MRFVLKQSFWDKTWYYKRKVHIFSEFVSIMFTLKFDEHEFSKKITCHTVNGEKPTSC